jgi:hypothetical protein
MIIVCPKCSTRLQIDDEKSPNRPIQCSLSEVQQHGSSGPANPATDRARSRGDLRRRSSALEPSTRALRAVGAQCCVAGTNDETRRMLLSCVESASESDNPRRARRVDKRKSLVCTSEPYRELSRRKLRDGCKCLC